MSRFAILGRHELGLLKAGADTLGLSEVDGQALHLDQQLGQRTWHVESPVGHLTFTMPVDDAVPGPRLAISDRVRRFAAAFPEHDVELSLVDGETVVARADTASAAVDLVTTRSEPPREPEFRSVASATVPLLTFFSLLWSARNMPAGLEEPSYPMPPMWLQLADGTVGLHVDWSDFLPSRATYRVEATRQRGSATVVLPHSATETFLSRILDVQQDALVDLSVTFQVGEARYRGLGPELPALRIEAHQWRLTLWLFDHLHVRWGERVEALLDGPYFRLTDSGEHAWTVRSGDQEVHLALHSGQPDIARVSTTIAHHADASFELLSELGALNAASSGTRYWWADGTVHAVFDVRCDQLDTLPAAVRTVMDAARRYGPMLAHL